MFTSAHNVATKHNMLFSSWEYREMYSVHRDACSGDALAALRRAGLSVSFYSSCSLNFAGFNTLSTALQNLVKCEYVQY